jgi:hypothetical protein
MRCSLHGSAGQKSTTEGACIAVGRLTIRCRRQHPPPSPRSRCARPRFGLRVLRLSSMPFDDTEKCEVLLRAWGASPSTRRSPHGSRCSRSVGE